MLKQILASIEEFFFSFSALHTFSFSLKEQWIAFKIRQAALTPVNGNRILGTVKNFIISFGVIIFLTIVSLALIIISNIQEGEPSSTVAIESSCEIDQAPITYWPIKRSEMDSWLDEMDGYVSHDGVFFMRNWNDYSPVRIKDQLYPHCIGVCIPFNKLEDYYSKANPDQQVHVEYIEYSLGYAYQTLQFDFGIDDHSYPDYLQSHLRCEFRIVVDSCDSNGYLLSSQTHLFDTDWLNHRCCARRTTEMDVSQCETVRITVMWRFYVLQNGPIAFNMVIANPLLRAAKYKK